MPKKTYHQPGNPDFRRHRPVPGPVNAAIEQRLFQLLSPGTFASLKSVSNKGRQLRERTLTLPVMVAIVLSLVYRQMTGLSEVLRTLEQEGLFWVEAQRISKQAVSQRLQSLPAHLFASLLEQVIERLNQSSAPGEVSPFWRPVRSKFPAIWLADGSTLEALKKKLHRHRGKKAASPLAGITVSIDSSSPDRLMVVTESLTSTLASYAPDTVPSLEAKSIWTWAKSASSLVSSFAKTCPALR